MGQEIDRTEETHQDCTSASDRPTNCVGCPIDAVFIEKRSLFDGNGVFCWTLWSGHEGGLGEGNAGLFGYIGWIPRISSTARLRGGAVLNARGCDDHGRRVCG